jgi:organic radical activating enzyme
VDALHEAAFEIAVETNGTLAPPVGIDWICVSPKAGSSTVLLEGNELKLVYPQADARPERFADAAFEHFYLQPMDGPEIEANTRAAVEYCLAHPQWRLSLQTHKITGIR